MHRDKSLIAQLAHEHAGQIPMRSGVQAGLLLRTGCSADVISQVSTSLESRDDAVPETKLDLTGFASRMHATE